MADSRTVSALIADAREYADAVDDYGYWTEAMLERKVNESAKRLHSKLARALGIAYRAESATLTLTSGDTTVTLESGGTPFNIEKVATLDFLYGGRYHPVKLGNWGMRHLTQRSWAPGIPHYVPKNFASQDYSPELVFFPAPARDQTLALQYVPGWTDVTVASGDTIPLTEDWFRWVALDVAIQMGMREKIDVRDLKAERAEIDEDIQLAADELDEKQPHRVIDTEREQADYYDDLDLIEEWPP